MLRTPQERGRARAKFHDENESSYGITASKTPFQVGGRSEMRQGKVFSTKTPGMDSVKRAIPLSGTTRQPLGAKSANTIISGSQAGQISHAGQTGSIIPTEFKTPAPKPFMSFKTINEDPAIWADEDDNVNEESDISTLSNVDIAALDLESVPNYGLPFDLNNPPTPEYAPDPEPEPAWQPLDYSPTNLEFCKSYRPQILERSSDLSSRVFELSLIPDVAIDEQSTPPTQQPSRRLKTPSFLRPTASYLQRTKQKDVSTLRTQKPPLRTISTAAGRSNAMANSNLDEVKLDDFDLGW